MKNGELIICLILTALIIGIEALIKTRLQQLPPDYFPRRLAREWLSLERRYNQGLLLSWQANRLWLVKLLTGTTWLLLMLVAVDLWLAPTQLLLKLALSLLVGGASANLLDRCRYGYVVDYLRLPHLPRRLRSIVFNLADLCIFFSALLLIILLLLQPNNILYPRT